jgi:hypothetical protein
MPVTIFNLTLQEVHTSKRVLTGHQADVEAIAWSARSSLGISLVELRHHEDEGYNALI